jgi:homoserine acetyltransferase
MSFPVITIRDMVRLQKMLIDQLGIESCSAWQAARWAGCRRSNGR